MSADYQCDVLIVGSGAAGLSLAVRLADSLRVCVISKGRLTDGCTLHAQGGISAVIDREDSIESHVEDTLNAGAGLCDPQVVRHTVEKSAQQVQWLTSQGVQFTRRRGTGEDGELHLTREGGHSHRRVVHADDATGRAIETTLEGQAKAHGNITLLERHIAIDLITTRKLGMEPPRVVGAYVLDRNKQRVLTVSARTVILATGGASKVYLYTSNPDVSTGDGVAMAWRAGCRVANMEFIQFHPTCLYHPQAKSFLITEAMRGEGARLLLPDGSGFLSRYDPRGELAPRDIAARAIDNEMKRLGAECVYLDISHKPADFIIRHFPNVYQRCLEFGFDITKGPIPVVPAAHYTCGGIMTDLHGRTDIENLYAIGETAYTGLHGANRMASNSLLECLVFSQEAYEDIKRRLKDIPPAPPLPAWDESRVTDSDEMVVVSHNWEELRRFMWDYVGIVRTNKRLQRAKRRIDLLTEEINEYYWNFRVTNDLIELRNLVQVADLIVQSALLRKESRGLHYTLDYPYLDGSQPPRPTILVPDPLTSADAAARASA